MKWPLFTYVSSTVMFTFLLGLVKWHGNDTEYRYYTAIRMHTCDIFKNNQATLHVFDVEQCMVKRHSSLVGQFINVSCSAKNDKGQVQTFDYEYSDVHSIYDAYFQTSQANKNDERCHG